MATITREEVEEIYSKLVGADLKGIDLNNSDLSETDLTKANLSGSKYDKETKCPDNSDPEAAGEMLVEEDN